MDLFKLVLEIGLAGYALLVLGLCVAVWIAWKRHPYPPEAAEAPLSCGCSPVNGQKTCERCGKVRCEWHSTQPHFCVDPIEQAFADARRIVQGRLPSSSVDELVEQFDWHGHDYELRSR